MNTFCDEYPYNSTWQGGMDNYYKERVSIYPVPAVEQRGRGAQGPLLNSFFSRAAVFPGQEANNLTWFLNFANPVGLSHWIDRLGNRHSF